MGKFDRQDLEVRARHVLVPTQMEIVEYGFLSIYICSRGPRDGDVMAAAKERTRAVNLRCQNLLQQN